MGLPTSMPSSGGEDRDRFSEPLPALDDFNPLPVVAEPDPEEEQRREFEEFQRWKRMQEAQASQRAPEPEPKAPRAKSRKNSIAAVAKAPTRAAAEATPETTRFPSELSTEGSTAGLKRRIHPKTGVSYYEIPKTKMGDDGRPVLAMDLNIDDLNGEAKNFLAHLQVAPSKDEQEEILRKRSELLRKQRAEREEIDRELDAKEGSLDEPVEDPFSELPKKKRGLFGRKS